MSQTSLSPQCSINDGAEFKAVADAMKVIGFKQEEIQTVYRIVAAILHLVSAAHGMVFRRAQIHLCSSFPAAEAAGRSVGRKSIFSLQLPVVSEIP